jgi:hypothetical protein
MTERDESDAQRQRELEERQRREDECATPLHMVIYVTLMLISFYSTLLIVFTFG